MSAPFPRTIKDVHEAQKFLYGFAHLVGAPATLYYLPTRRHRRWRKAWSVPSYSEIAFDRAMDQLCEENWFTFKKEFENGSTLLD